MMRAGVWLVLTFTAAVMLPAVAAMQRIEETSPASESGQATVFPSLPTPDLEYSLRQGRAYFLYYCAICHGEEGRGDGFNAYNLDPKPRDLSDPTFHRQRSDEDLADIIHTGGGAAGLSSAMPPWGRTLDRRQIRQLVLYLRELPKQREDGGESP